MVKSYSVGRLKSTINMITKRNKIYSNYYYLSRQRADKRRVQLNRKYKKSGFKFQITKEGRIYFVIQV